MTPEELKSEFEKDCCRKIQKGYSELVSAILDGSYQHPATQKNEVFKRPKKREEVFLRHLREDLQPFFEKEIKTLNSLNPEDLSYKKIAMLFLSHARNIPELGEAMEAANALILHNIGSGDRSETTTLPNGITFKNNVGATKKEYKKKSQDPRDTEVALLMTISAAISHDESRDATYFTYYITCLDHALSEERRKFFNHRKKLAEAGLLEFGMKDLTLASTTYRGDDTPSQQAILNEDRKTLKRMARAILRIVSEMQQQDPHNIPVSRAIRNINGESLADIARDEGVTSEAIRQSVGNGLRQIRAKAAQKGITFPE